MSEGPDIEVIKPGDGNDGVQESEELPNISALELLEEGVPTTGSDRTDQANTALDSERQLVADMVLADLTIDGFILVDPFDITLYGVPPR